MYILPQLKYIQIQQKEKRRKENSEFQGHSQGSGVPRAEGRWDAGAGWALSPKGRGLTR